MHSICPQPAITADLRDWILDYNADALTADGFDDAIIGIAERCSQEPVIVYDARRCIEILVESSDMNYEDAAEFFHFNMLGAWCGENTPLFLWRKPQ